MQQHHYYSVLNQTCCVAAPVQTVKLERINSIITCRSDGLYPEPDLTWEPSPSSPPETKKIRTVEGLYTISSSVSLSDMGLDYSCTVSTSKKRVTLFKQSEYGKVCSCVSFIGNMFSLFILLCLFSDDVESSDSEATINCGAFNSGQKSLTWRFNKTQLILTRRTPEDPCEVSEEWKKYVKDVSKAGSLTLQDLSSNQDGVYTCELSDSEEIFLNNTVLHYQKSKFNKVQPS